MSTTSGTLLAVTGLGAARDAQSAQRSMQGALVRTRCGYLEYHPWGAQSTHTGEMRRARRGEMRLRFRPVSSFASPVVAQASAENEASPLKPTSPNKVGARSAGGSTRAVEPDGSRRPVSSPRRSAPLGATLERLTAHNCRHIRCSRVWAAVAMCAMRPLRDVGPHSTPV